VTTSPTTRYDIDAISTVEEYLDRSDWRVNANANQGYSLGGLILNSAGKMIANYWLERVYSPEAGAAHRSGDIHIHDLDMFAGYCAGWSLKRLIQEGFNGVSGAIASAPPKHFSSACGQIVNFLGTLQNEWAGAQAFSSFDTYMAPFVRLDNMTYEQIVQSMQELIYNLNVPSRWGSQCPFTTLTFDWTCPDDLVDEHPLIGDEIVEPGREARPGTVFDANGHALSTAITDAGAQTFRVSAVPDERSVLRETIEDQLVRADLILTTGGISYGSGDTVREVLSALGTVRFDSVAAWPGHILGVGTVGGDDQGRAGTPIFCLPGDPVSAQVCFEVYVRPALRHMQGWTVLNRPSVQARVDRSWYSPRGRREFVRVRLVGDPHSGYQAKVMGAPASLLLSALADSNALAVVPEDVTNVRVGDTLRCMVLD